MTHPVQHIEVVRTSLATGDIDNAIGLVEETITEKPTADAALFRQTTNRTRKRCTIRANTMETIQIIQSLSYQFKTTGEIDFLDNAIGLTEEMIAATPRTDVMSYLQLILSGLSEIKSIRMSWEDVKPVATRDNQFEATGDIDYCDSAIGLAKGIVGVNPSADHMISYLSSLLGKRYKRTGDLDDLEQAIKQSAEIVAATPSSHPKRPQRLTSLSNYLFKGFNRLGALDDLEKATQACEGAVTATPPDHPNRVDMLNNLSCCLYSRLSGSGCWTTLRK